MTTPDSDTFKDIIEANIEERLRPEDMESLFQVSGGLPTLAILMHDIGVKYGEETEIDIYSSFEEAKTDVERARATLNVILNGIKTVYEKTKRINLALLTLFVQLVAHEELEAFCKSEEIERAIGRLNYELNLDSYKRIVEIREEKWSEIREGKWVTGERKFYGLNENWRHMRLFMDVLCDKEEGVKGEIETVRSVLLDIMDEESERTARATIRMIFAALDDILWLKERVNKKPVRQALRWGMLALLHLPKIGFDFLPIILKLAEDVERDEQLFASAYACRMVKTSLVMNFPLEVVNAIIGLSEQLTSDPTRDPAVLAYRAEIYSFIAVMMCRDGIKSTSYFYMEKAEQVVNSISDNKVRDIAKIRVWLGKASLYSICSISDNEAWNWAENALSMIEELRKRFNDYVSNEFVINYLKPYGGNVEEKLKEELDAWYGHVKGLIGRIYMVFDWLEEAENACKEALKYSITIDEKLAFQGWIGKIKAIMDFQFEDFEKLYEQMKMYEHMLSPMNVVEICAGYVLACLFSGEKVEKEEETLEQVKTNSITYALLLGTAHLVFRRFEREEVLKALKRLEMELRGVSPAALASVLRMLIENEKGKALEVAEAAVSAFVHSPLLCRLFAELAEGIRRGNEEETNKALIKLFYYHV